jgi:hypothetical protein
LNQVGGHCPKCGAEYRPGFTECSDCGVHLVPGPGPAEVAAEAAPREGAESETESVCALPWEEAWLMAGRLRADGIPARVYPESQEMPIVLAQALPGARAILGETGLGRSAFEVLVRSEDVGRAGEIVRRYAAV